MEEDTTKPKEKKIKVLRTYTSDMAEMLRENEMSVIKIALAEKEKREREDVYKKAEGTNFSKILLVLGGIIFIGAAIFGSSFLIKKKELKTKPQVPTSISTFISYDESLKIDTTNMTTSSLLTDAIKKEEVAPNSIKALFLTKNINDEQELLTTRDFLSIIQTTIPSSLIRSLSDNYLVGKYLKTEPGSEINKPTVFLVFETTNYPQAYASMLEWEETMLKDLFVLLDIDTTKSNNYLFRKQWKDVIVNNKDARVLYGEDGEDLLYYLFTDKNHFIITSELDTLKEVNTRLITKNHQPS